MKARSPVGRSVGYGGQNTFPEVVLAIHKGRE